MRLRDAVKGLAYATVCAACVAGFAWFANGVAVKQAPRTRVPLRGIALISDGTVTGHWLAKILAIKKGTSLSEIDIFAIKKRLLEFGQIRDVCVEKRFPDSIVIRMYERHPLLKFAVKSGDGEELLFVDSKDGTIFAAACMPRTVIAKMPYAELRLERSKESRTGLKGILGIEAVANLIKTLEREYPEIHGQIGKFSLKKYDHRSGATWSRIEVIMENGQTIAFGTRDIDGQLANLDYLRHERNSDYVNAKKIDLAKIDSVIMEGW